MSTYEKKTDWEEPAFSGGMLACPLKENWLSFQLVDELGKGSPYAGLGYTLRDSADQIYVGTLDSEGSAKINDCYRGPTILCLDTSYAGSEVTYNDLIIRESYPLPITELQVRAEKTRSSTKTASAPNTTLPIRTTAISFRWKFATWLKTARIYRR